MDSLHLIHYIDSLGVGGAQSMMFELYYAFSKYYPSLLKQQIWLADNKRKCREFVSSYGIEYSVVEPDKLESILMAFTEPVILLYHKLMGSKTEAYRHLRLRLPVIVVNHTLTKNMAFNKIAVADLVVCVSGHMKKLLRRKLRSQRMGIIRNGVNLERYQVVEPRDRPCGGDVFLSGRINSFNTIKYSKSWLQWCLNLKLPKKMVHEYIGDGMYLKRAKKYLASVKAASSKNGISLLGLVRDFRKKISIIKNWDVFLYEVNRDEGISIAILEALACGVPVICSDHYGNKEIIEQGVNGFVFRNRKEAQSILSRLCSRPDELDNLKRSTLRHFRRKLDARYVAEEYVDKILDVARKRDIKVPVIAPIIAPSTEADSHSHENKLFSVLTAARNVGNYLGEWARSLLNQSYRPLEVVFVDDYSKDNTFDQLLDIYKVFQKHDIVLKIVKNEKRLYCGTSYAKAWENASGFYFGVLDGDDMLLEEAIKDIVNIYENFPNVTYIYTQFLKCDPKMQHCRKGFSSLPAKNKSLLDMGDEGKHVFSHWRTFSRRFPKIEKIWGRGLRAGIDKYMGYRLEEFGTGMFVNKAYYKYRWNRPGCISKTEKAIDAWKSIIRNAYWRRKEYKLVAHPIVLYKDTSEK